jgi:hypothetical protein
MREWAPPGTDVFVQRVWRNRVGDLHDLRLFVIFTRPNGRPDLANVTYRAAQATDSTTRDRGGQRVYRVNVGGSSPTFEAVYELGLALYGDGYALNLREI